MLCSLFLGGDDFDRASAAPQNELGPAAVNGSLERVVVGVGPRDGQVATYAACAGLGVDCQGGVRGRDYRDATAGSFEAHVAGHGRRQNGGNRSAGGFGVQGSADVAEAEFASTAFDFRVTDPIQDRDVAARSVDVQFAAAAGDLDPAAAGVEIGCAVAVLGRDVTPARVGLNVPVEMSPPEVSRSALKFAGTRMA